MNDLEKLEYGVEKSKILKNTSYYIEHYLNPLQKWNPKTSPKRKVDLIRNADVDWSEISKFIKAMSYRDFLETPYWKAVAAHAKYKAGYRCLLCKNCTNLVAHHRNYNIHGMEHAHVDELIVLCNNCHQKFHDNSKPYRATERAHPPEESAKDTPRSIFLGIVVGWLLCWCWAGL